MTSFSKNKGYKENSLKPEEEYKDKDALIKDLEERIAELTAYLNELKNN